MVLVHMFEGNVHIGEIKSLIEWLNCQILLCIFH